MKKLLALVLALIMVMSLATTAFAADDDPTPPTSEPTTKVTIKDTSTYTDDRDYEGHRVLTASVSDDKFAYQVNPDYKAVLIQALGLASNADDNAIISGIEGKNTAELIRKFAGDLYRAILAAGIDADESWTVDEDNKTVELPQGYWLIADVTDLDMEEYANSLVMIDTVGNTDITINNKPDVPNTKKEIDDEDDSVVAPVNGNEDETSWQESADYDIGDLVPFHISGQLPNNIASYDYYMFLIGDTVKQGLTYDPSTFKIYVKGFQKTIGVHGTEDVDFWYTIDTVTDDNKVQVSQSLYVYPAYGYNTHELNDATTEDLTDYVWKDASQTNGGDFLKLFAEGTNVNDINSATFNFTYKCRLNENAVTGIEGNPNTYKLTFSNNPYGDSFGETAPDTTITLTYKTVFNKVDGEGKELTGADFEVYKFVADPSIDTDDEKANAVELVSLTDNEATEKAVTDKTLIHHPGANAYGYLVEVGIKQTNETTDKKATQFSFVGLDAGYYRLIETVTPDGYNGINPVDFHIIADHDKTIVAGNDVLNSLTALTRVSGEMTMDGDVATGTLTADVENNTGKELPSTGGMGTTLFYVFGTIMVMGAIVLLVTKKRMAA